jgi:raffinose/stachyose/melibiose transport system substrate-binding protein
MKNKIVILLVIAFSCMMLGACAGNKEVTPQSSTQETQIEEPVVISIFHYVNEEAGRNKLDKHLAAVTAKYPKITFDVQGIDFNQFQNILKTKISAGDAPDIFMGRPAMFADLIKAGHVMSMDGQAFLNNVIPAALESMKVDGKTYSAGTILEGMGIFYNKDVFTKNDIKVPTTHSELIAVAEKLKANGVVPFAHGFKDGWTAQADFQSDFYGLPLSQKPTFYMDIVAGKNKFKDFPEFKVSLQRYKDRLNFSSGDEFGTDYSKSVSMLANGDAAMVLQGTWAIAEFIKANPKANLGFFTTPNSDTPGESVLGLGAGGTWLVSSQTKKPDAVWKFFEQLTSQEGAAIDTADGTVISAVKGAPTTGLNPMVLDILKISDSGKVYNYEAKDIFTGQYDATFRKFQEEFAADKNRDVDKYIDKLDTEFDAIR